MPIRPVSTMDPPTPTPGPSTCCWERSSTSTRTSSRPDRRPGRPTWHGCAASVAATGPSTRASGDGPTDATVRSRRLPAPAARRQPPGPPAVTGRPPSQPSYQLGAPHQHGDDHDQQPPDDDDDHHGSQTGATAGLPVVAES